MIHPFTDVPAPFLAEKKFLPDIRPLDAGMRPRYPVDSASWVWHPQLRESFLHFRCAFTWEAEKLLSLHFSCGHYAELYLDGHLFARGPEASGKEAYAFSSFDVKELTAGEHTLDVFAWWLGKGHLKAPLARDRAEPGLLVAGEAEAAAQITTGIADWQVAEIVGLALDENRTFPPSFGIGGGTFSDLRKFNQPRNFFPAKVTQQGVNAFQWGVPKPTYALRPARLPEQKLHPVHPGRVRALVEEWICANGYDEPLYPIQQKDTEHPEISAWQQCWSAQEPLTVPPNSEVSCLIDLEDYYCGFPEFTLRGGRDAELAWDWSEGLLEVGENGQCEGREHPKGHRDVILNKAFRGLSDTFIADGSEAVMRSHWWRAGRYVLLRIRTADEALTLKKMRILETGYPLDISGSFQCDQANRLEPIQKICLRGLLMCMHETYMDCPFYEQLMYVFDTRLEILTTYALSGDDRLPRRAIELFDVSRGRFGGLSCSRFPSQEDQLIPMFSLCWSWMVRDYLYWRDDAGWLQQFMPGVRAVHDAFENFENAEGLLADLPGWTYADWVQKWGFGCVPEGADGVSAIMNLVYVHSLQQLADLEKQLGSPLRADAALEKAGKLQGLLLEKYWSSERRVLLDTVEGDSLSQHAQIWGILSGTLKGEAALQALETSLKDEQFVPASYMLRSHLFDALVESGQGGRILEELWPWEEMLAVGAKTGFEHQEPTRSDCHAWSSHPLYHLPASVLGIRPDSPGFKTVRIQPQPGSLKQAESVVPHPEGEIRVDLQFADGGCTGKVRLPGSLKGVFCWQGQEQQLQPGENDVQVSL